MQIKQVQMAYAPEEDRILMRLNTDKNRELRCWLTRRMIKLLLPKLDQTMQDLVTSDQPLKPESRQALIDMTREATRMQSNLNTPFYESPDKETLLSNSPLLIAKIDFIPAKQTLKSELIIRLATPEGKGFELKLTEKLQHGLIDMLIMTCEKANWGLPFRSGHFVVSREDKKVLN